jgi:hypothetical protein
MMYPGTRTVLDIGGQDTKAIQVDEKGIVDLFQMNDRCAAGCGRYLGYIADEMNIGLHELGPMAMSRPSTGRINSTCTVFAGAELRDRLALGEKREDIMAGLHRAIILRAMSIIARSGGIAERVHLHRRRGEERGGGAALRKLVDENYGALTMNINPDSIYTGALGAAPSRGGRSAADRAGGACKENEHDDHSGIDVGSGAIKAASFRSTTREASRLARAALPSASAARFPRRSPRVGLRRSARRRRPDRGDVDYIATTGEGENVCRSHRPLLRHDHACTRRRLPGPAARAVVDIGALHGRAILHRSSAARC